MIHAHPTFTAVYVIKSPFKANGNVRTCYRNAPKGIKSHADALCWFYDKIATHGKGNKRLVEIRIGS